jgi:hypothetical protein
MTSEELTEKLKSFMGLELDLKHKLFLDGFKSLDDESRNSILSLIFANYLVRGKLLSNICTWCADNHVDLPNYSELLDM